MEQKTFPGKYSSLAQISEFARQQAALAGLDDDAIYQVDLSVDEACSNVIEHAYDGEGKGDIEIACDISPEGLVILIHDYGRPFNPDSVPLPNAHVPLEKLKVRGVGLFLMKKMMDEVSFEFTIDRGNFLKMVKKKHR